MGDMSSKKVNGKYYEFCCNRVFVKRVEELIRGVGEDGASCLRGMLSRGSSNEMFELYVTSGCAVDIFEVNI